MLLFQLVCQWYIVLERDMPQTNVLQVDHAQSSTYTYEYQVDDLLVLLTLSNTKFQTQYN